MDSGSVPASYELENIQGLSGSTVYASNIRNLHVRTNNIITGSQDQYQEAELEAMRQIVQGPAPPQFRSSFHEEQKGNTSPQHEGSAKQAVSSFPTVGLALSPDRSSSAVPDRNSLDLEAGNFSIDAPGAFHDNKPKVTLGSHKKGGKIEDKKWNPPLLDGFPKSAGFIVLEQDRGATIFRRFDEPAMRNLLYLQSRVAALTRRLKIYDAEDWTTNDHSARRRLEDLNGRIKEREDRLGFERQPIRFKPSQDQVLEVSGLLDEIFDIHGKGASASEGAILDISQRIADLEGCVRHADTPLKDLVDVNSPIPGNYRKEKGKEEEKQPRMFNGLKIRRQERSRMRISRLLCYIARILEISPEVLLLYLLAWPGPDYDRYTQLSDSKKMEEFLCMAFDPPLTQINDVITGLEVLLQNYLRRYLDTKIVPPAASVAAKSWEDFEMFGSAEKMRKRRLEWEDENPDKSWPFLGLSDAWIRKMQDRWNLALDLKEAIKEYHEALLLQHKLFELPKPAERTRKAVWNWYISARQFSENSQVDLIRDDVITIRSPAEEDRVSKLLSRRFPLFFLHRGISNDEVQFTSERKVGRVVTGINMIAAISILVVAVWVLSVVNDYKQDKGVKVSKQELGTLTGFVVGFALWVGFMTGLPRREMFGAIAVYAAVLVVFVGSTG